jgi:low affinity Fe/Cu permease
MSADEFSAALQVFSSAVSNLAGSTWAFTAALLGILLWAMSGPFFQFSDTWQLVFNSATNMITFLMVFLIQRSQNKDTLAIQLKLNELILAAKGASNRLVNVEKLTEEEVTALHERYQRMAERIQNQPGPSTAASSIEEVPATPPTTSAGTEQPF